MCRSVTPISVIVPAFNSEATLRECLDALLGQDYPANQYEVIIVDNNSTDSSAEIVRGYQRVTLLRERKRGSYAARNRGLREAGSDIIAFTDSDCVARPDWLSQIDRATRNPRTQVLQGRVEPGGRSRAIRLLGAYEHHKDQYVFSRRMPQKYYGHTNNLAVRREVFVTLGPFVERERGADAIFMQHAVDRFGCEGVRYEPRMCVKHLEIKSTLAYFRKMYTYGRARHLGNRIVTVKALTMADRINVFREMMRSERLSAINGGILMTLLIVGAGCWYSGEFSARADRKYARR
jgi:glycosyltransferase involved in cell wall biosynthesis